MKVLLDECVPKRLRKLLSGHDCQVARQAGLLGKVNGELLRLADLEPLIAACLDALARIQHGQVVRISGV